MAISNRQFRSLAHRERQLLARTRDLLEFAVEEVPFYRAAAARYAPAQVETLSDLRHLPLLRKADLRANHQSLKQ